jgi:hypothetical protein
MYRSNSSNPEVSLRSKQLVEQFLRKYEGMDRRQVAQFLNWSTSATEVGRSPTPAKAGATTVLTSF